jgi:hypothetical protein
VVDGFHRRARGTAHRRLQCERDERGGRKPAAWLLAAPSLFFVVLSPAPSTDGQRRFVVTFFVTTNSYRRSLTGAPRLTIPIQRTTEDIYAEKGTAYAVLLDRDTEVDYVAELLKGAGLLAWDDHPEDALVARSWVQTFADLGGNRYRLAGVSGPRVRR